MLHNLSFVEDPTRVFRGIRFEQRLGFRMATHTENLIKNSIKMNFLEKLGGRRLFAELVHIFEEHAPQQTLRFLRAEQRDQVGKLHILPERAKLLDGQQEAKIIALRLGKPPKGFANWSLRLLADQVVELGMVGKISHETLRTTLKKTA